MNEGTPSPGTVGDRERAPAPPAAPGGAPPEASEAPEVVVGFEDGVADRWTQRTLRHVPAGLLALAVFLVGSHALAIAWYALARLGYVLYAGFALHDVARRGPPADLAAREAEWQRFRRRVGWLMDNDAAAFVALALVTHWTLDLPVPVGAVMAAGALLVVVGFGSKIWATASLPPGSYYWRNFFFPAERTQVSAAGPYRWLSHPMYSVGYAHAYGWALLAGSLHALVAAACAQTLMLALAFVVERRALATA